MILEWHYAKESKNGYPCTSGDDPSGLKGANGVYQLSLHKRG